MTDGFISVRFAGSSPAAPISETLVQRRGFFVWNIRVNRKVNRAIDLIWRDSSLFSNGLNP